MDIQKIFGDSAKQQDGIWAKHETGAEFLIVYSESKECRDFTSKEMSKARMKNRYRRDIPAEKMTEITLDLLVRKIVKDWKGLENKGQPFPFSPDNCRYLLENSAVLRDFVSAEAADPENFGIKLEPDDQPEGSKGATGKAAGKSAERTS